MNKLWSDKNKEVQILISKETTFNDGIKALILYNLTTLEINAKKERADRAVITTAHFPYIKRFDDFDFDF
jgi:hypothetical protein